MYPVDSLCTLGFCVYPGGSSCTLRVLRVSWGSLCTLGVLYVPWEATGWLGILDQFRIVSVHMIHAHIYQLLLYLVYSYTQNGRCWGSKVRTQEMDPLF